MSNKTAFPRYPGGHIGQDMCDPDSVPVPFIGRRFFIGNTQHLPGETADAQYMVFVLDRWSVDETGGAYTMCAYGPDPVAALQAGFSLAGFYASW